MEMLGHESWKRQTVGQVEKGKRNLTVDELISLAAALQTTVAFLVSPAPLWSGYPGEKDALVDAGGPSPLDRDQLLDLYGFQWQASPSTNIFYAWEEAKVDGYPRLNHGVLRIESHGEGQK